MKYADLNHPSFPQWMREGLDKLFAADERFEAVEFELYAVAEYNDHTHTEMKGYANFIFREKGPDRDVIPEDEMDYIPQVRMFERRAVSLWNYVPLQYSVDEGFYADEYVFSADRKGNIRFWQQAESGSEHEVNIQAIWEHSQWKINDYLLIPYYEGTHSDLLIEDANKMLESYNMADFSLKETPKPISVTIDEDGFVRFQFEAGELTRCMEPR